jgi:hypothetical protein
MLCRGRVRFKILKIFHISKKWKNVIQLQRGFTIIPPQGERFTDSANCFAAVRYGALSQVIKDPRKADNPEAYSIAISGTGPSWGIGLGFLVTSKIISDCTS